MDKSFYITLLVILLLVFFCVGGLWGVLVGSVFLLLVVIKAACFVGAVLPLWWARWIVERDISISGKAASVGMNWWVYSYTILCVGLVLLPTKLPSSIVLAEGELEYLNYVVAALVTFPIGLAAFKIQRFRYRHIR
jgi:hypothetical protein